jgi:hypothetical protein
MSGIFAHDTQSERFTPDPVSVLVMSDITSQTNGCVAGGVLSRAQYDAAQQALLLAIFDDDEEALAQAEEGLYPKTMENAEAEIRNRGFALPAGELARIAAKLVLPRKRVGRNSMWSRAQIDAAVAYLSASVGGKLRGRLTDEARARLRSRHQCDGWLRMERALYPHAKANLDRVREEVRLRPHFAVVPAESRNDIFSVWQSLGGDPGEVWPHRWSAHEIAKAAEAVVAENKRSFSNFARLVKDPSSEMDS